MVFVMRLRMRAPVTAVCQEPNSLGARWASRGGEHGADALLSDPDHVPHPAPMAGCLGDGAGDAALRPEYTLKLFDEFRRVGRTTLLSTVVTGLVQGALATIGYFIIGLPRPLFFGALTAVASPVPGVGTMLVWVPAGIVLVLLGHPGRGIVDLTWGVLVVTGIPDYVVRPRLVGRESDVPALLTFTALFGGAEVFGLKGLILGPVLMAIAIAVLRLYADEARSRRRVTPSE